MWYLGEIDDDPVESLKWWGLAADHGRVVPQDHVSAYMWYHMCNTAEGCIARKAAAEEQLTSSQIDEAQRLARECVAKDYKGC